MSVGDLDGVGFPVVAPTLTPGAPPPAVLTGCEVPDGLARWPGVDDWVWVGAMTLGPVFDPEPLLLEISTAMIATTPMAAAPMPANKKVRLPG